jgi:hypothetical protein
MSAIAVRDKARRGGHFAGLVQAGDRWTRLTPNRIEPFSIALFAQPVAL